MSCLCNPTQSINACTESLTIGAISSIDTDVLIYIQDNTTGRIEVAEATSDGAGLVVLDMTANQDFYMPSHNYSLWITLADATSMDARETITIDTLDYECISPDFERCVLAADELMQTVTSATVVIA